jgi:hypothetical protein
MSKTSALGKVYQYGQYGSGNYGLILYDFDIGSSVLKQGHKEFLDSRIIPTIIADPTGYDLAIIGYASRRWKGATSSQAAFENNQNLAQDRGYAAHDYILSKIPSGLNFKFARQVQMYKENNYSFFPEDERQRAVYVRLSGNYIPDVKEIPVPNWTKEFDIKLIAGLGVNGSVPSVPGASLGIDHLIFEIRSTKGATCMYKFYDLNLGASVPTGAVGAVLGAASGSWTPGPPAHFKTKLFMPVDYFYGEAVLMQDPGIALGETSVLGNIYLSLKPAVFDSPEMFDLKKIDPDPITMSSGNGFQFNLGLNFGFPSKFEKFGST